MTQYGPLGLSLGLLAFLVGYVVYQRCFHPLAKYPGPFLASMTNFWKFYHYKTLKFPETMIKIHEKYGPIVRIGPNDLNFNSSSAIPPIYKSGRKMPKSQFYNAFTSFVPNLFGTTNEQVSALIVALIEILKSIESCMLFGAGNWRTAFLSLP